MLNRSILVRGAFIGLLLAGLVALADSAVRYELRQATSEMATVVAGAQLADGSNDYSRAGHILGLALLLTQAGTAVTASTKFGDCLKATLVDRAG